MHFPAVKGVKVPDQNGDKRWSGTDSVRLAISIKEMLAKAPPELRQAAILRLRRAIRQRRIELQALKNGVTLTLRQLRQASAAEMERLRQSTGQRMRFRDSAVGRRAEIEVEFELLTQALLDRIAELPSKEAIHRCYVEGLDPPGPDSTLYVNWANSEEEQVLRTQKRLLAALPPERQEWLMLRLARAYLARGRELDSLSGAS